MARKEQRKGANSVDRHVDAFKNAPAVIEPPEGVELETDELKLLWSQFSKARVADDWRDFDLVLLAKIVRLESEIRFYQKMLSDEGAVTLNQRGTMVENPLIRVIDTLQRQQLSVIRSLSLTQTGSDPRTKTAAAKVENQALKKLEQHGPESLIATPH